MEQRVGGSSRKKYDAVVIGAGIVGLATAYQLKRKKPGLRLAVFEKEDQVAEHQSGHNSGVIHSGVYYPPKSNKAKNCILGYQQLIEFCQKFEVAHEICGKLIVATDKSELPVLEKLCRRGQDNGLKVERIDSIRAKEIEPHINCIEALRVPQAGITSYRDVAGRLFEVLVSQDVNFYFGERVSNPNILLSRAKILINCAGLYSDKVYQAMGGENDIRMIPFRGEYYHLKSGVELVKNLIYPLPDSRFPFLGVHLTRKIDGSFEAGPNAVLALAREGYSWGDVHWGELAESLTWPGFLKVAMRYHKTGASEVWRSFSKRAFLHSLQKLVPELSDSDLVRGGSGVRAQLCDRSGKLIDDFLIRKTDRVIHVLNAPSPAATSCFAIGESVADEVLGCI